MPSSNEFVISLGTPSEKQDLFLRSKAKFTGFGGSRGGGKSWSVRAKAIILCMKHSGIKVMIVRKTYPELTENHVKPLKQVLKVGMKGSPARYNESKKEFKFANGSTILLRYCDTERDLDRFQGLEIDVLFIDEATQMTEHQIKVLTACVRGVNSFPKKVALTCNPGGVGHGYIKRIFVDRKFTPDEDPDDYIFIKSLVTDNKVLMAQNPDYIKQLEALPPKLRQAWLEGRWDVFQGAFFEEFRPEPDLQLCHDAGITQEEALEQRRFTHVIKPFNIPKEWKIYRSYDWGFGRPFSVSWYALDFGDGGRDGTLYRILELYGCTETPNEGVRWTNKQQMAKIAEIEREHPWLKGKRIMGVADPSIWDGSHDGNGISCADEAERMGLWFEKGINDRIAGWMQVHERLKFSKDGYPMLYFFDGCKAIIRTMPLMMHDEHKVEDLDTSLEDHACDELRYMCMHHMIKPRVEVEEKPVLYDPLNQFTKERFNRITLRRE